jgi:hypothetical protein
MLWTLEMSLALLENWLFRTEFSDKLHFVRNHFYISNKIGTVLWNKCFDIFQPYHHSHHVYVILINHLQQLAIA